MNDDQRLLAEMAEGLFQVLGPTATIERDRSAIEQVSLPGLLLPEDEGGFAGSWEDALVVFRLAGYHAVALPVAEAAIAASLTCRSEGRGTIAARATGTLSGSRFTGTVSGLCQGAGSSFVVAPCPEGGTMVFETAALEMERGSNIAGEGREIARMKAVPVTRIEGDVFALGALARVAQTAGALDAALARTVDYVNERQQFGRALGKFQAVQQSLATFACEAAAANCAAMGAAQAMGRGMASFEIAAAKLRANRAIGFGTALAHQVHAAIGFTDEYPLHPITRRLWAWRSEFGNDDYWAARLGSGIVVHAADNFWPDLTALTD